MKAEANSATSHQDSCTRLYATIITIDIVARYLKIITAERQKSPCQFSFTRFALYIVIYFYMYIVYIFTSRHGGHVGVPKQRKGSHVGVSS